MQMHEFIFYIIIPCISVILLQLLIVYFKGTNNTIKNTKQNLFLFRKFQHSATAVFILILNEMLNRTDAFWATFFGFLFLLTIELIRHNNEAFNATYLRISSSLLREEEKVKYSSAYYFVMGTSLSIFFFSMKVSSLSVLFVGFGDPFASIFGILYESPKIYKFKSISGFLGCFTACFFTFFIYHYFYMPHQEISEAIFLFN